MEQDQELLKRYTDCIYFLASPFTCKKGMECEYRHNEIARLNPRDCWYWLAGSCLNATCAFRHPPLDGHIEMGAESAFLRNCGIPMNKKNAPCYFYFNGYCNKGEQCSFMHGLCDGKLAQKSAQTASTVIAEVVDKKLVTRGDSGLAPTETKINTAIPLPKGSTESKSKAKHEFQQLASFDVVDTKLVTRSDNGSAPTDTKINTAKPVAKGSTEPKNKGKQRFQQLASLDVVDKKLVTRSDSRFALTKTKINTVQPTVKESTEPQSKAKQEFQQQACFDVVDKSASPTISASECEEEAFVRSESPPSEGFVESQSLSCTDQSSEEQVDCHLEQEEWCESSPGLDVLVDDKSDDADFEDDPEYVAAVDFEKMELNGQFSSYAYKNPVDGDPAYLAETYDHLDDEHYSEYTRSPKQPKVRVFDRLSLQKGYFSMMELTDGDRSMDLRNHLKRQRLVNSPSVSHSSESLPSSHLIGRNRERPISRGSQYSQRKLALGVEKNILRSHRDDRILLNVANKKQRIMNSGVNYPWHLKENRLRKVQFSSGVGVSQPVSEIHRSTRGYSVFTGPKTLDQIKEERKRCHKTGDTLRRKRYDSRTPPEDFQGPKSLSVILKDKRRLDPMIGDDN